MSNKIEGVPEGWELVRVGRATEGDWCIGSSGTLHQCSARSVHVYPIVCKLPEPLKIDAGKYYKQRCGQVIGPIIAINDQEWPWTTEKERGNQWSTSGERCLAGQRHTDLVEEVSAPQPTYRPFASAEEFKPFRDKWIQRKPEEDGTVHGAFQSTSYGDEGCYVGDDYTSYADLLTWKFEDGTPCGMKVS